ncbi:ABC transporter permease [Pseudonocardia broussonetiae]|uniref:ABC transporter permease n=1 Tax=Pseudonocardia broussonetiae TaxID=2736640 RepID=A0A6M6JW79_9PSEU|nr:ABC transporter permease [Pseudonocardia broussonetiae]QJY50819.1 ABC transporter permease [Pseudonocardia broussonetiae]
MRRATGSPLLWPLLALAGLLLYNLLVTPAFFALRVQDGHLFGSMVDVLRNGAPTALIALAMTLVIATRGIDLSVGASAAIAGAVACTWIAGSPDPAAPGTAVVAIALAVGLCLVLGAFNGMLVSAFGIQPIIATLVLMTAGRGLAQLITDGQIVTVSNPVFSGVGGGFLLGLPIPVLLTGAAFAAVALLTRRTALGLLVESVGINPTASRLAGIRSRGIVWGVYVLAAVCAGVAGLMISSTVNAADANNAGLWIELDAILAVVIGGTLLTGGRYSLTGTLVGALVLQTLTTTVYTTGIRPEVTLVFKALVIIAVCLLQSPKLRRPSTRRRRGEPPAAPPAPEPVAPATPTPASAR